MGQEKILDKAPPRVLLPTEKVGSSSPIFPLPSLLYAATIFYQRLGQTAKTDRQTNKRTDTERQTKGPTLKRGAKCLFARDQAEESGQ